ncbi:MAG: SHOCT domain-containing protein [Thermaerobacter sp.]|jgi:putative membrane protein|nr:SHOCT domain-containing protein [Thermaerobacter sp.]
MFGYGMMGGYGLGIAGGILMLVFWVLVVVGLVLLVRYLWAATPHAAGTKGTALELLKERYARGEIGKEEFDQKRRDLQ